MNPEPETTPDLQFRTDVRPFVWLRTNLGWVPIGNTPDTEPAGHGREEAPPERARYMAGWAETEPCCPDCGEPGETQGHPTCRNPEPQP